MSNIQNISRSAAVIAAGALMCALAACSKTENRARTTAANPDTNLRSSVAGNVGDSASMAANPSTTTANPPAYGESSGVAHNPQPGANRESTDYPTPASRTTAQANPRTTTTSSGGTVPRRSTRHRSTAVAASATAASTDSSALTGTIDPNFLAEPQIFTVVFLANIGDSTASTRAICLNPATSTGSSSPAFNDQVRNYAQQMIRDHAQLNQKALAMQRAKSVIPTRSEVGDQVFSANTDAMYRNENPRDYIAREVQAHQNLLNTLDTRLIPNARDSSLRQLLTEARQVVMNHLAMAQTIQNGQSAVNGTPMNNMSAPPTNVAPTTRDSLRTGISINAEAGKPGTPTTSAQPSASASLTATYPQPSQMSASPNPYSTNPAPAPSTSSPCDRTNSSSSAPSANDMLAPRMNNMNNASPISADSLRARPDTTQPRQQTPQRP